jgi:hypothetical protein
VKLHAGLAQPAGAHESTVIAVARLNVRTDTGTVVSR